MVINRHKMGDFLVADALARCEEPEVDRRCRQFLPETAKRRPVVGTDGPQVGRATVRKKHVAFQLSWIRPRKRPVARGYVRRRHDKTRVLPGEAQPASDLTDEIGSAPCGALK